MLSSNRPLTDNSQASDRRAGVLKHFKVMNSHIRYKLTKTTIMLSENTPVYSYGIDIIKDGKKLISYNDVLPDKKKVKALEKASGKKVFAISEKMSRFALYFKCIMPLCNNQQYRYIGSR